MKIYRLLELGMLFLYKLDKLLDHKSTIYYNFVCKIYDIYLLKRGKGYEI